MAWSSSPVRNLGSQPSNAGSNPVQAICPHCKTPFDPDSVILTANRPISHGDFTVCLDCREIIRFGPNLQLLAMCPYDWLELTKDKELFVAMLRFRLHLLVNRGRNGSPASAHWSKPKLKERETCQRVLAKIDKAINAAIINADYEGVKKFASE